MYILSIKSKRWNIAMHHFYFLEKPANVRKSMKVVGYTHSLVPSRKLVKSETIHIDLQEHELSLYLALSEGNRKILRRAQKESYQVILYKEPSIENLRAFQQFYNQFAKRKRLKQLVSRKWKPSCSSMNRAHYYYLRSKVFADKHCVID